MKVLVRVFLNSRESNISSQEFYFAVFSIIYNCGYLTGDADEKTFWQEVQKQFVLSGTGENLRDQIFSRFTIQNWILETAEQHREQNILIAILSNQTGWLDPLKG